MIYTDNRQMYFVYPLLLLVSVYGLVWLAQKLRGITRFWQLGLALIIAAGLASPVYFMLRYHPNEEVYFNFLAGPSMAAIKEKFPVYAWGVSDSKALQYILETDHSKVIKVQIYDTPARSSWLLPPSQYKRLDFFVNDPQKEFGTYYILTVYRFYPQQQVTKGKVFYSVRIGNTDICTVYKVENN